MGKIRTRFGSVWWLLDDGLYYLDVGNASLMVDWYRRHVGASLEAIEHHFGPVEVVL